MQPYLPTDLWEYIMGYLNLGDKILLSLTCKRFRSWVKCSFNLKIGDGMIKVRADGRTFYSYKVEDLRFTYDTGYQYYYQFSVLYKDRMIGAVTGKLNGRKEVKLNHKSEALSLISREWHKITGLQSIAYNWKSPPETWETCFPMIKLMLIKDLIKLKNTIF